MKKKKKVKICLLASSGGHYDQMMLLNPLLDRVGGFVLTERTAYSVSEPGVKARYLIQVNRKEPLCIPKVIANTAISLWALAVERPNVVISTGAMATIPMCLLIKLFGGKLIFIESFAKSTSPTVSGKFLQRFADRCYVQWPSMLEFYPDAVCLGGIY